MNNEAKATVTGTIVLVVIGLLIVVGLMVGIPPYNVWRAEMKGRAQLAQAEQNRQIMVLEAQANYEAEVLNARAEVARARGAAEAMRMVEESLTPEYIKYLWVRQLDLARSTVIYIPTEANLPLLEAGRFR